jgi:hypothetical protein
MKNTGGYGIGGEDRYRHTLLTIPRFSSNSIGA